MKRARYTTWNGLVSNLEVGDILFIQNVKTLSKLVRYVTRSYWSHVGMIFEIMHADTQNRIVLVIEAQDAGIEIHCLHNYVNRLGINRIGVKRLPGLTEEHTQKIRGFFLNEVDTPYDYRRMYSYFLSALIARISGFDMSDFFIRKGVTLENFVCSSFVQRAFYLALPPRDRDRAVFRQGKNINLLQQLEVCSPTDIAKSTNTEWLWNPHR